MYKLIAILRDDLEKSVLFSRIAAIYTDLFASTRELSLFVKITSM